jgi:hypothetical protein
VRPDERAGEREIQSEGQKEKRFGVHGTMINDLLPGWELQKQP